MDEILSRLTEKKNRIDTHLPLPREVIDNLNEWFRIELTYTSNALEGNTLTRQETALVVEEGLSVQGKSIREHLEAVNHAQALDFIQKELVPRESKDITQQDLFDIHRIILHKTDDSNAGRYRNVAVRLKGSHTILPNPLKVPELMGEYFRWLQHSESIHPVRRAADAHYRLVSIHPFVDGNGRTARLVMNLILMKAGYPPAIIRKEDRIAYITSLERAQSGGSLDAYYSVICESVDRSLDIYLVAIEPERVDPPTLRGDQRFYTTEEVAKLLQIDPESVRRYVRSGRLKAMRLGGRMIRIDRQDLDIFIEQLKEKK